MAEEKPTKHAHNFKDLTGQIFGRLTAVAYVGRIKRRTRWLCECACGTRPVMDGRHLLSGVLKSCGCYRTESLVLRASTHGRSKTKEYDAWIDAKTRCFNPNTEHYGSYGGRGITMSEEWRHSFETFFSDMGQCPKGYSLDRIDVDGPYSKGNCRWASKATQMNNMRKSIVIEHDGQKMSLRELADSVGISYRVLYGRYFRCTPLLTSRR